MAMAWVHSNIASFGGDPQNVMVFGQSAGAMCTSIHTTLPDSWPYFSKAGMTSGGYSTSIAASWAERVALFPDYELTATAARLGCDITGGDLIGSCFLKQSTEQLIEMQNYAAPLHTADGRLTPFLSSDFSFAWPPVCTPALGCHHQKLGKQQADPIRPTQVFAPTVDCVVIPAHPWQLAKAGQLFPGSVLIGSDYDEAAKQTALSGPNTGAPVGQAALRVLPLPLGFVSGQPTQPCVTDLSFNVNSSSWRRWVAEYAQPQFSSPSFTSTAIPNLAARLEEQYPFSRYSTQTVDDPDNLTTIGGDYTFSPHMKAAWHAQGDARYSCPALRGVGYLSNNGNRAFLFIFKGVPISAHHSDVRFYFMDSASLLTREELELSVTMATYWTNFATSGDPNRQHGSTGSMAVPFWPQFKSASTTDRGAQSVKLNGKYTIADRGGGTVELIQGSYSQGACDFWDGVVPGSSDELADLLCSRDSNDVGGDGATGR